MYDIVRWIILGVLFAGLFGLWYWSKRQTRFAGPTGKNAGSSLRVMQKRWIDKGTGVCLVEAEGETYLLAYTANGGVSWQPMAKKPAGKKLEPTLPTFASLLPELKSR
jgi:hypothetical protein